MLACRIPGAIIYFILFFSLDLHVGKIDICSWLLLPEGWVGEGYFHIHAICRCAGWGFKQFLLNKTRLVHCD